MSQTWKQFEREIRRKLQDLGFSDAMRNWSNQFQMSDKIDLKAGKYIFQLKHGKSPSLRQAWVEANSAKEKGQVPIGVCRSSTEKNTLVVLSWKDFAELLNNYEKKS